MKQLFTKLILIEKGNSYKRFVGREMTNHVVSEDRPLTLPELEQFRLDPRGLFEPEAA